MEKVHIRSSPMKRVVDTSKLIQEELRKIGINTQLRISRIFSYDENEEYYPKEILDEWREKCKAGKSEDEFVEDFLDGKRRTKPAIVAKNYLKDMGRIFKGVINKKSQFSIVSFRHGAKTKRRGKLSKLGRQQAIDLGEKIGKNIEQYKNTLFIATHNTINESIVRCLIDNDNLPDKWRKPLDFTETIKYTFFPESDDEKSEKKGAYLEIEWRGLKKEIPFDEFKKCISGLENKNEKI